jgi:RND family efflux transporter MFP subunit
VAALVAVAGIAVVARGYWTPDGAVAQAPQGQAARGIPVEVATAQRKKLPVQLEALGTVTPIASVAIKSRIETEIVGVHFADGATVKQGDLLFTLDGRVIEAQIKQADGQLARDKAQLEGSERDVRRYTELVAKAATPQMNLDNAKTQSDIFRAAIQGDEASLQNLRVQLSYCTIRAPISGRISGAAVKIGNFVRPADVVPLATIIQLAPVYVTFSVPQRNLPDIRQALAAETATLDAIVPGDARQASGQVTFIENTVDASTGMVMIRATMPNTDDLLWPGTLVNTKLTLRIEDAVSVPATAVQVSQQGSFVFVVKDGAARVQPVTVARVVGNETVIEKGLVGGEVVVTDGHLLLTNGSRVAPRERKAGA